MGNECDAISRARNTPAKSGDSGGTKLSPDGQQISLLTTHRRLEISALALLCLRGGLRKTSFVICGNTMPGCISGKRAAKRFLIPK